MQLMPIYLARDASLPIDLGAAVFTLVATHALAQSVATAVARD